MTAGGLATATALGAAVLPAAGMAFPLPGAAQGIKISKMFAEPLSIEMEPFPIALGVMTHLDNAFVRIVLENGIEGYGEAAPIMTISGENQQTILDSTEWDSIKAHQAFHLAGDAFDEAVTAFFAPIVEAAE